MEKYSKPVSLSVKKTNLPGYLYERPKDWKYAKHQKSPM
jgi:hypothetical protein